MKKVSGLAIVLTLLLSTAGIAAPVGLPDSSTQVIIGITRDWSSKSAALQPFERATGASAWRSAMSAVSASIGRNGLAWGNGYHNRFLDPALTPEKREGDGKSPAGIFPIPFGLGFDAPSEVQTRLPYVRLNEAIECIDFTDSSYYNQVVDWTQIPELKDRIDPNRPRPKNLLRVSLFIGHNTQPAVPGFGSCVYVHLRSQPNSTTAGCTAIDEIPARALLRWLDPAKHPLFVLLPQSEYDKYREAWDLP